MISKGMAQGSFRNPPEPNVGQCLEITDMLQVTTGRRRTEPPSEGSWLVKMTQRVWGVNLKVCSPYVKFSILTQLCLHVA